MPNFPDFPLPEAWELVATHLFQPDPNSTFLPVWQPALFSVESPLIAVRVELSVDRPNWYRAGWAVALIPSPFQGGDLELSKRRLSLRQDSLLEIPRHTSGPYAVKVGIPRYFQGATVTVWQYLGDVWDIAGGIPGQVGISGSVIG